MKEIATIWIVLILLGGSGGGLIARAAALQKQVNAAYWLENHREYSFVSEEAADEAQDAAATTPDEYPGQIEVGQVWQNVEHSWETTPVMVTRISVAQSGLRRIFYRSLSEIKSDPPAYRGADGGWSIPLAERAFLKCFRWVSNGEANE